MTSIPRITLLTGAAFLALGAGACAHAGVPDTAPSYTAAQANEGEKSYQAACVGCHGADLAGDRKAPSLAGASFAGRWNGRPVEDLIGFMREHMPRTFPGLLNDRTYTALVAYLLAKNDVPAGGAPLTADASWTIRLR